MNANEVIAELASRASGLTIHPNDDVNMSQSSNDVIPTAIHVSASISVHKRLIPALEHLIEYLENKKKSIGSYRKNRSNPSYGCHAYYFWARTKGWISQIKIVFHQYKRVPSKAHKNWL